MHIAYFQVVYAIDKTRENLWADCMRENTTFVSSTA